MEPRSGKPTVADIAHKLQLSKTAVSYALNGRSGVGDETRQRVLDTAAEIGYIVRRRGPRLARNGAIGAVLSPTKTEEGQNYYVAELLAAAERFCGQQGLSLIVRSAPIGSLATSRGDPLHGWLLLGGSFSPELVQSSNIPTVMVGAASPTWACDSVFADNQQAARLAVSYFIESGRGRIAFINGPESTPTSLNKQAGFDEAITQAGLDPHTCPVIRGDFSVRSGYESAKKLFGVSNTTRPDAVFVADDPMGLGALHAFDELGLTVPDDVAIIGLGDSAIGRLSRPALSTVSVFQDDLGRLGAKLLLERINGDHSPTRRISVLPKLVFRETTPHP